MNEKIDLNKHLLKTNKQFWQFMYTRIPVVVENIFWDKDALMYKTLRTIKSTK